MNYDNNKTSIIIQQYNNILNTYKKKYYFYLRYKNSKDSVKKNSTINTKRELIYLEKNMNDILNTLKEKITHLNGLSYKNKTTISLNQKKIKRLVNTFNNLKKLQLKFNNLRNSLKEQNIEKNYNTNFIIIKYYFTQVISIVFTIYFIYILYTLIFLWINK